MLKNRKLVLFLLIISLATGISGQLLDKSRDNFFSEFLSRQYYKHAAISISLRDVKSGEILAEHHGDMALTPASLTKLLSMAFVHEKLAPEYTYETSFGIIGDISEDGTLFGELIVDPSGDPSLFENQAEVEAAIDKIINWIKTKGIKCIEGGIKLNVPVLSGNEIGPYWPYQDIGNYYAPGIYSFNVLRNTYVLNFSLSEDQEKGPRLISADPDPGLVFINELVSGEKGSGDQAYIYGDPYGNQRFIRGSLPRGIGPFSIKGSLPDPFICFARILIKRLEKEGVECADHFNKSPVRDYNLIHTETSESLSTLISHCLKKSDNLYAESLFKSAGVGFDQINSYQDYTSELGFDKHELLLFDGSGLSPQNRMSTNAVTKVLSEIESSKSAYRDLLPRPDDGGSLKRYASTLSNQQIQAKTGYMQGVRSIGGYLNTEHGLRAFCIIINNHGASSSEIYSSCGSLLLDMCQKL